MTGSDKRPAASAPRAPDAPSTTAQGAGKPHKRRRRWLAVLLWIVGAAVVLRLLLWLALPIVLDSVAGGFGLRCELGDLSLSLRTGRLELHDLTLLPKDGPAPADADSFREAHAADGRVGALEYAVVDLDMQALLSGRLHAERVDVDGLEWRQALPPATASGDGTTDETRDGTTDEARDGSAAHEAAPNEGSDAGREPVPTDLTLPFSVAALRVQHARCLLRDDSVSPPLATMVSLDVRLSDLGSAERPARLLIRADASGVLDELRIEGTLSGDRSRQAGDLSVLLRGLHPAAVAGYLTGASIAPVAGAIGLRLSLSGEAQATGAHGELCSAKLSLDGLRLDADGRTALALQSLRLDVPSLAGASRGVGRTELGELLVTGLHAAVERLPSGALRVAGLDLLPATPDAASPAPTPVAAAAPPHAAPAATPWSLAQLALSDVQLDVRDGGVSPVTDLRVQVAELKLGPLQSDAGADAAPAQLSATLHAPGLCDTLTLAGTLAPFGPLVGADVSLQLEGLVPQRAEPYLRAAGLRSTLQAGSLALRVQAQTGTDDHGALTASARLSDLILRDGERTLLALPAVVLDGFVASADGSGVQVRDVDITGPALDLRRDAGGALHLLGLATLTAEERQADPAGASAPAGASPAGAPVASPAPAGPRWLLGQLRWHDIALHVIDEAVSPPIDLALRDAGLELTDLAFGGDPARGESQTGKLTLRLGAEGIVQQLVLQGTVESRPGPLDLTADLALQLTGIQGGQAAAWMEAAGLQSAWADGRFALALHAVVAQRGDVLHADAELGKLALDNAGQRWLGLERLSFGGVEFGAAGLRVGALELAGLDLRAERDAQGGVLFAGVRLPPAAAPSAVATSAAASTEPAPSGSAGAGSASADATAGAAAMHVVLERLALDDVRLHVVDAAVSPTAEFDAQLAVLVTGFDSAAPDGSAPAQFDLTLAVPGTLERLALQGDVLLTRDSQRLRAALLATGLGAGALSGYLPSGVRCELRDGRLALQLDALHEPSAAGGERVEFSLHDVRLNDGAEGRPLFALSRLACVAPRLDVGGGVVELDELSLRGVQLAAHRGADGALHALGMAFGNAAVADAPAKDAPGDAVTTLAAPDDAPLSAPSAAPTAASTASPALAALPEVRLKTLDVELEQFAWRDESQPGQPEVLARLRLFNPAPLELLSHDPEALPPWELVCVAGASPVIEALKLDLRIAPFIAQPSIDLKLAASGIRGAGLTAVVPSLAAGIDGSELVAGTLAAQLDAQLQWPRRSPVDFDLSHGFGLRLALSGLELRAQPQGELLAGLDGLELDVKRISPASGDVHVERLELRTPHALLVNRADGMRVLGLRLIPAPPGDATDAATAGAEVEAADPAAPPAAAPAPGVAGATTRAPEFRLDAATITGLDLQFRDETLSPPLLLPINALDAELTGFNTSPQATRPMRFGVFLGAGEVPLPKPVKSSSVLAGFASATVASLAGADESQTVIEQRRVFQEISLTGRLTNGPSPQGWAQLNIAALELMSFASAARSAGVVIGDGVLDASVKLRFLGSDGLAIDSSTTLTDLSLSEPANGPISQYLKLPAPLDTVVFLLRDQEGRIVLDLNLGGGAGGVSGAELAHEAVATLGALTTRAVASSPLRMTGTLTDAFGVTGGVEELLPEVPVLMNFGVADAALQPDQLGQLAPLLARLAADENLTLVLEHVLGEGDVAHEALLANPPAEETAQVVERLRQMRGELQRQREELAAQASSYFAVGREDEAASASEKLRSVDHDLGVVEQGLDHVLDLMRPGAERRADQRTRMAGLALGNQRLATVAAALREAGLQDSLSVIEVRPARWLVATGEEGGHVALTPRLRPKPQGLFSRLFGWMWPF